MSDDKHPETEIEVSSGNIFADLGLDNADELYTRACLGVQIMKIIKERGYNQKEAAELLGLKQPEISAIMRAKFSRFSPGHFRFLMRFRLDAMQASVQELRNMRNTHGSTMASSTENCWHHLQCCCYPFCAITDA